MKYYVLFNPIAGNGTSAQETKKLFELLPDDELELLDITDPNVYSGLKKVIAPEDGIIVSGGDGTLNRFINDTEALGLENSVFYFATGSGNDFLRDVGGEKGRDIVNIDGYIRDLPTVTVKGKTYRVLNGVGYGIDGYCCEVGDELRKTPGKKINYTAIAIKGLLFHYKPTSATVTVDGVSRTFKHVWLAPTMNGRFYGGGMIPTPGQSRTSNENVSTLVYHCRSKLRALIAFPSIFKGTHTKHEKMCQVFSGQEIRVEFDRPTPLQIDGETILNVTEYTMKVCVPAAVR